MDEGKGREISLRMKESTTREGFQQHHWECTFKMMYIVITVQTEKHTLTQLSINLSDHVKM